MNNMIEKSKQLVMSYMNEKYLLDPDSNELVTLDQIYVVWFCKTLQNWKALASSNVPDNMYYEITYNGDTKDIYFDAYKKVENIKFLPEGGSVSKPVE